MHYFLKDYYIFNINLFELDKMYFENVGNIFGLS